MHWPPRTRRGCLSTDFLTLPWSVRRFSSSARSSSNLHRTCATSVWVCSPNRAPHWVYAETKECPRQVSYASMSRLDFNRWADLFLFALPNQNAGHSTPERIRMTDVGSFYEPLVAVQMVVMQLLFRSASGASRPHGIRTSDPCLFPASSK